MAEFKLGQRVAYSEQIVRRYARPGEFGVGGPDKVWSNEAYPAMGKHPGGEGLIVGKRTLSEGRIEYNYDNPAVYTVTRTFPAYLVAFDLRRNPVYVLPEHLTPLEQP